MTIYQPLMKGQPWKEHSHKFNITPHSPVFVEIKHDEIRLHVIRNGDSVVTLSYAGKPMPNLDRWKPMLHEFMVDYNIVELDMGVEVNGNFNDSYRWCRSTKSIPDGLTHDMVKFHLYDLPDDGHLPYIQRVVKRMTIAIAMTRCMYNLPVLPPTYKQIDSSAELDVTFVTVRAAGKEGLMIKLPESLYYRKKGLHWFKMKPEETHDGVIQEVIEAVSEDGVPLGRAGSVLVRLEDGSYASPSGIAHDLGEMLWTNREEYIQSGQWVEFKCMERDRQGGYRHPSFVRLREAKC